ncbi:hypothetical protein UFOVP237_56 [uncultured Caudovirales phage]|uniref:Uncharacterized protein n=1 Tax=uncultured Caudovirales phage TaxID=2100421 RepID=A0A6J7WPP3_9CAUD|nr:hypothetical protein UFOVP237_56 [uncultured Caudovirales phage]
MATSFFNNVEDFSIVFTYSPDANKTAMNIMIDTSPRIDGQATMHEEAVLMYRGTPSQLRTKLKEALSHFLEAKND